MPEDNQQVEISFQTLGKRNRSSERLFEEMRSAARDSGGRWDPQKKTWSLPADKVDDFQGRFRRDVDGKRARITVEAERRAALSPDDRQREDSSRDFAAEIKRRQSEQGERDLREKLGEYLSDIRENGSKVTGDDGWRDVGAVAEDLQQNTFPSASRSDSAVYEWAKKWRGAQGQRFRQGESDPQVAVKELQAALEKDLGQGGSPASSTPSSDSPGPSDTLYQGLKGPGIGYLKTDRPERRDGDSDTVVQERRPRKKDEYKGRSITEALAEKKQQKEEKEKKERRAMSQGRSPAQRAGAGGKRRGRPRGSGSGSLTITVIPKQPTDPQQEKRRGRTRTAGLF